MQAVRRLLTYLGTLTAQPISFVIVAIYSGLWAYFEGFDWHAGATIAVWCMTLLIQRAEHRDTQAIHAKLDELLHAQKNACDAVAKIDKQEPEDIERYRDRTLKE